MKVKQAVDDFYARVSAMVPEATSVSVSVSRQTSFDRTYAFDNYTIMVSCGGVSIAHASSLPTEAKALKETMRQIEKYRKAKLTAPTSCPTCGQPIAQLEARIKEDAA